MYLLTVYKDINGTDNNLLARLFLCCSSYRYDTFFFSIFNKSHLEHHFHKKKKYLNVNKNHKKIGDKCFDNEIT